MACNLDIYNILYFILGQLQLQKNFELIGSTFLGRAGHSCRCVIEDYKDVNILSLFLHEIKPPTNHSGLKAVPIASIEGKAVHLKLFN